MLCQPIIPKNTTITDAQLKNFDSFEKLLAYSSNPIERYNRASLNTITSKVNYIAKNYDRTSYPVLDARIKQGALTVTEIAEFMSQYFYVEQELLDFVVSVPITSTETINPFLNNLEYFLDKNMSSAMTGSFCAAFANPFQKIMELSMFLDGAKSLIADLRNFDIATLLAPLFAVKEMIFGMIEGMAKQLISKINSIVLNVVSQIQNLKTAADRMFKFVNKKAQEVKEFFNDFSLAKLMKMVESTITKMAGQFEKLTPEVIAFLLFRICQLIETIKNFLENPVDALESLVFNMMTNTRNIVSESNRRAQIVINNGGVFVPVQDRVNVRNAAANAINDRTNNSPMPAPPLNRNIVGDCTAPDGATSSGGSVNLVQGSYVTLPMSPEEQRWVQGLSKSGDRYIQFNDSVKNMGSSATQWWTDLQIGPYNAEENFADAGWKMIANVNPFIFAALARVSTSMNRTLYLNSCYRSPYYNWYLKEIKKTEGVASNSYHTKAMACDVSTSNMSNDEVAYFIQYASREGFNRLSVYNTFVHVDIAAGNYRGNWTGNYRGNSNIQEAVQIHLRDGFRHG